MLFPDNSYENYRTPDGNAEGWLRTLQGPPQPSTRLGEQTSRSRTLRLPSPNHLYHLANGIDHQLRLVILDKVTTPGSNHVRALR